MQGPDMDINWFYCSDFAQNNNKHTDNVHKKPQNEK